MLQFVLFVCICVGGALHAAETVQFDPSSPPKFNLNYLGTTEPLDVLASGQNPLVIPEGSDAHVQLRGRNRTQANAGLYLNSLEGLFEGEFVVKLDRSELTNSQSGAGLMARYALSDAADFSALIWRKDGAVVFRKKMGSEYTDDEVARTNAQVAQIWMRLRIESNVATYAIGKVVDGASAPTSWIELGDRTTYADFLYMGMCLFPGKGQENLESVKFTSLAYQPVGGNPTSNGQMVAARFGFSIPKPLKRLGTVLVLTPLDPTGGALATGAGTVAATDLARFTVSTLWDWTSSVTGESRILRIIVKDIPLAPLNFLVGSAVDELDHLLQDGPSFGKDRLPPYESVAEGYHEASGFIVGLESLDRAATKAVLYSDLKSMVVADAANAAQSIDWNVGEWTKIQQSNENMKIYLSDAIAGVMAAKNSTGSWPKRKYAVSDYHLYTGSILERGLTRTRKMLSYCADAGSVDMMDFLVFSTANDWVDCGKSMNRFANVWDEITTKYYDPVLKYDTDLKAQRDGYIQDASELLELMGMLSHIDKEFEATYRPQRNDLFGKLKWLVDGIGGPLYDNSNIPVKVYAALAMNRISNGKSDPVFQQFNQMISDLIDDEGANSEGTDYLSWMLKEALPVYSWGIINGWITADDVPLKVRLTGEWALRSADGSGYIPRVDDASFVDNDGNPTPGLDMWLAPFSSINQDGQYLDYCVKINERFKDVKNNVKSPLLASGNPATIVKFLTYPVNAPSLGTWNANSSVHTLGGIGKVNYVDGNVRVGMSLLAESGTALIRGGAHDQQDNSSFTLNRWDPTTTTVDHLVIDPGYGGYGKRKGEITKYIYHNTPFVVDYGMKSTVDDHGNVTEVIDPTKPTTHGGVSGNGYLTTQMLWDRATTVLPSLSDYLCSPGFASGMDLQIGSIVNVFANPNPFFMAVAAQGGATTALGSGMPQMLMTASQLFTCGAVPFPDLGSETEVSSGGGSASFQHVYTNGVMNLQNYDESGTTSQRAMIHEGNDVLVLDFFDRTGEKSGRKYGVNFNLPGLANQVRKSSSGGYRIEEGNSLSFLQFFGGNGLVSTLADGDQPYDTKTNTKLNAYRISQAYAPSGASSIFPHLSLFQVADVNATLTPFSTPTACQGTEICVERTVGNVKRIVFVRSGFPNEAGTVTIFLKNGKTFQSDAGFGILDEDQNSGVTTVKHLYHLTSASLAGASLTSGTSLDEWPLPVKAMPRANLVKAGPNIGTFPQRVLQVASTEVSQWEYASLVGSNPGIRKVENLPVTNVTWYDAIVYANLKSKADGMTPSYSWSEMTRNADGHVVALNGLAWVQSATGYRLPTAEEWTALAGNAPGTNGADAWLAGQASGWLKSVALGKPDARGLYDLWGNAGEWIWTEGEQAQVAGGTVSSPELNLTGFTSQDKTTQDGLVGFRLVRSEAALPAFFQFEDGQRPWRTASGQALVLQSVAGRGQVLQTPGGWQSLNSSLFRAAELGEVGDKLLLDLYLPSPAPGSWLGDVQVAISAPSQNVYNHPMGTAPVALSGLSLGNWHTLTFSLDAQTVALLKGNATDLQWHLIVNTPGGYKVFLDNLRFGGALVTKSAPAVDEAQLVQIDQNLLGFETLDGWSSSTILGLNRLLRTKGAASLRMVGNYWHTLTSRPLLSKALVGSQTKALALDLFVPNPQPNIHWYGTVGMVLESKSANLSWTAPQVDLKSLKLGAFSRAAFALPTWVQTVLAGDVRDLRVTVTLNTAGNAGSFLMDNLRSEP